MIKKYVIIVLMIVYHNACVSGYRALLKKNNLIPRCLANTHNKPLTKILMPPFPTQYQHIPADGQKTTSHDWKSPKLAKFMEKIIPHYLPRGEFKKFPEELRNLPIGQFEKLPVELLIEIADRTIPCSNMYQASRGFRSFAYLLRLSGGIDLMNDIAMEGAQSLRAHFVKVFSRCFPKVHPCLLFQHLKITMPFHVKRLLIHDRLEAAIEEIMKRRNIKEEDVKRESENLCKLNNDKGNGDNDQLFVEALEESCAKKTKNYNKLIALFRVFDCDILETLNERINGIFFTTVLKHQNREVSRLCLAVGADPNYINILYSILLFPNYNVKMVELLLDCGADPNQWDHLTRKLPLDQAKLIAHDRLIRLLKRAGAISNLEQYKFTLNTLLTSVEGSTLPKLLPKVYKEEQLFSAICRHDVDRVRELLSDGADPNVRYKGELLPISLAINKQDDRILKVLLIAGAKPCVIDNNRMSPLALAIKIQNVEAVGLLLMCGADPYCKDKQELTAFDLAKNVGRKEIIDLLKCKKTYKHRIIDFFWFRNKN